MRGNLDKAIIFPFARISARCFHSEVSSTMSQVYATLCSNTIIYLPHANIPYTYGWESHGATVAASSRESLTHSLKITYTEEREREKETRTHVVQIKWSNVCIRNLISYSATLPLATNKLSRVHSKIRLIYYEHSELHAFQSANIQSLFAYII